MYIYIYRNNVHAPVKRLVEGIPHSINAKAQQVQFLSQWFAPSSQDLKRKISPAKSPVRDLKMAPFNVTCRVG